MNVKPADTTSNHGTDLTVSGADGRSSGSQPRTATTADGTPISSTPSNTVLTVTPIKATGNPTTARIKIPVDRLPAAPEPTLPIQAWEKVDTFAGIEHDYRVRKAVKKKNVRKERER